MRAANQAAWQDQSNGTLSSALDSSLKKNTAFIKKARVALTFENLTSLRNDIETLSLEKYITEVVSAVAEGLSKVRTSNDVSASTEVVSLLHQRFSTRFTSLLAFHVVRALAPAPAAYINSLSNEQREKEEPARVVKQKYLLRIATELWLVGIFRSIQDAIDGSGVELKRKKVEDHPLPVFCVREFINGDLEFNNLTIISSFAKSFAAQLIFPESFVEPVTAEVSALLQKMLTKYLESLKRHLLSQSRSLAREMNRLEEQLNNQGSSSSARENSVLERQKMHDKQIGSAQQLAQALHVELPSFAVEDESSSAIDNGMIRGVGSSKFEPGTSEVWEDEDQRRFYEVLVDLQAVVPSDLLSEGKSVAPAPASSAAEQSIQDSEPSYDDADLDNEPSTEDEEVEQPSTTTGAKVESLLIRLSEMNNTELIDKAAVEFAFLNSKASRNRLLKTLLNVPVNRSDILPYYARFLATLHAYLPSIGNTLVASLHRECRRFVARKSLQSALHLRLHNARYISELLKFGVAPPHAVFHCFRIMIESFTTHDIEVLSLFLESCGRFLLRTYTTSSHMAGVLETLKRKSSHLSGVERGLIENAFYYVNPPQHSSIPQNEQSVMEKYIDRLIYVDLTKKSYDKILRQVRKLVWQDRDIHRHMLLVFTQAWKIKQASLPLLASLLHALAKQRPAFAYEVIDIIMEDILCGLEENKFRDNQKRITSVKFISELYISRMLDSQLILRILYLLTSYGHPGGRPTPGQAPSSDLADDFFRVRLVLTILNTCGHCFDHTTLQKKIDIFLCFFQYYIKVKSALPLELELDIKTTLTKLRPDLILCPSLETAAMELDEATNSLRSTPEQNVDVDDTESTSTISPGSASIMDEDDLSERSSESGTSIERMAEDTNDAEDYVLLEKEKVKNDLDREADEEFEREFGRMLLETSETRKMETRKPLDIVLPARKLSVLQNPLAHNPRGVSQQSKVDPMPAAVSFTMLSRKGKSHQLHLPKDSSLALNNAAHKIAELEEKKTIRELTLRYEDAQNRNELEDAAKGAFVTIKQVRR